MSKITNQERVIAISGGSRGIGLEIAKRFAGQGWQVAIAARSAAELKRLQKDWSVNGWKSLWIFSGDLSQARDCRAWGAFLGNHCGALDALVNNLGVFAPGTLLEGPEEQLAQLLATNLLSAHHLTRACLPLLRKAENSNVLTIGSVATTDWPADLAVYALSKYALEGWHRQLQKELSGSNIRTGLLRPGATFTSSWDGIDIDPQQLLSAERVAAVAAQMILSPPNEKLEEVCLRPRP